MAGAELSSRSSRLRYTLGPALRIRGIKNMGRDLALEELRISHDMGAGGVKRVAHGDASVRQILYGVFGKWSSMPGRASVK